MTAEQIHNLIANCEGLTVEFKSAQDGLPQSLFQTICAFLNKSGGYIFLGVNDDKTIIGLNDEQATQYCKDISSLSNNPNKLFPAFLLDTQKVEYEQKTIVTVFVPISSQVHSLNGKIYDRSFEGDFEVKSDDQKKTTVFAQNFTLY